MSRRRELFHSSLATAIIQRDVTRPAKKMMVVVHGVAVVLLFVVWSMAGHHHQSCCCLAWQVKPEAATQQQQQQHNQHHERVAHPPVYVDTKYWIRSTEFGEQDNWLNQLRPCTLAERIKMTEQSVVSMSNSMDSLSGSLLNANTIKELTLAQSGLLLLEEDQPEDSIDSAFIDYLKLAGDCTDGDAQVQSGAPASTTDDQQQQTRRRLFEFEPDSDQMSWFNPDNWASTPNEFNIEEWIPESHRIPCSEDIVVFGSRHGLMALFMLGGERDKIATFKVNFRPSKASLQETEEDSKTTMNNVDSLRVSRLLIGDRHYDQEEFEKLIQSDTYRDILFQFNDSKSALKVHQDQADYYSGSPLIIDESSLVRDSSENICLDEAGCLCGNERIEMMKVICSFNEPINEDDMPCHDPIQSAGHCNKICATSLTITMDPTRFSERFVNSIIEKTMMDDYRASSVLVGPRRIDDDKYEILFRYIAIDDEDWSSPGIELDCAQMMLQKLEKDSIKSFYGIRAITTKSSIRWRQNNRSLIFWLVSISLSLVSIAILARKSANDHHRMLPGIVPTSLDPQNWLNNIWTQVRENSKSVEVDSESFAEFEDRSMLERADQMHGSFSNIPLMELDENDAKCDD